MEEDKPLSDLGPAGPHEDGRPKLSDDEILAVVFLLGRNASDSTVWRWLNTRLGEEISLDYVGERLHRLSAADLISCSPQPCSNMPVRLTAAGVERLRALEREPLAPRTA